MAKHRTTARARFVMVPGEPDHWEHWDLHIDGRAVETDLTEAEFADALRRARYDVKKDGVEVERSPGGYVPWVRR